MGRVCGSCGEYGECVITSLHDSRGALTGLRIDRADPRILITRELLEQLPPPGPDWPATFDGEIVRIRGENLTVVYRITGKTPCALAYEAEWLD